MLGDKSFCIDVFVVFFLNRVISKEERKFLNREKVVKVNLILVFLFAFSRFEFGFLTGSKSIISDGIVSTVIFVSSYVGIDVHSSLYPARVDDYSYGK